MPPKTIIVQMTEGTTMIIPSSIWDCVSDEIQDLIATTYQAIEEYERDKAEQK